MILAHHGGELPALVTAIGGGAGMVSVSLMVVRERLGRLIRRRGRRDEIAHGGA